MTNYFIYRNTKRKVKLSLYLIKHHTMKTCWGVVCFTPGERAPGTHWIGGWIGLRTGLDAVEKRKISCPYWESNPNSSAVQSIAIPIELPSFSYIGINTAIFR
jgi:hypothetical protein